MDNMPELHSAGPAEHIDEAEVLRRFDEKKRLLETLGGKSEAKEIFREAFREHTGALLPQTGGVLSAASKTPRAPAAGHVHRDNPALDDLLSLALDKGIGAAVRKARSETPYLIDALHDELADHYYEKLVAAGKLKQE